MIIFVVFFFLVRIFPFYLAAYLYALSFPAINKLFKKSLIYFGLLTLVTAPIALSFPPAFDFWHNFSSLYQIGRRGLIILLLSAAAINVLTRKLERAKLIRTVGLTTLTLWCSLILFLRVQPTTYFRRVLVPYPDTIVTYRHKDILKHVENNQKLLALAILQKYEGVETIEFRTIQEDPDYYTTSYGRQFTAAIILNGGFEIRGYFMMLTNLDDNAIELPENYLKTLPYDPYQSFLSLSNYELSSRLNRYGLQEDEEYEESESLNAMVKGGNDSLALSQLEKLEYLEQLEAVDITYYTKNDIYQNED